MGARPASSSRDENGCASLAIVIGVIVGAVLLLQRCGSSDTTSEAPPAVVSNAIDASLTAAIAPQAPATITPLSSKRARKGASERSEEQTSALQSLMRLSHAVFCW